MTFVKSMSADFMRVMADKQVNRDAHEKILYCAAKDHGLLVNIAAQVAAKQTQRTLNQNATRPSSIDSADM